MTTVELTSTTLVVHMEGANRVLAFRSRIEVPLEHIAGAHRTDGRIGMWRGLRLFGTHVPGVIVAGTFREKGETVFWDVHDHRDRAIAIELHDERYARLIVEVEDPDATVAAIGAALRQG